MSNQALARPRSFVFHRVAWAVGPALILACSGCAIVPVYQRAAFVDPAMDPRSDALETRSRRRLQSAREGAAGGDGLAAGGGCGCGN